MFGQSFLCFVLFYVLCVNASSDWKYSGANGPQDWDALAPACGDSSQSPIDFQTNAVVPDDKLGLLNLGGYNQQLSGQFINNGHSVQLNFPEGLQFTLSGKGINGNYTALQLHFHWKSLNTTTGGSEHTVNGLHYNAEMHIVHIKDPYTGADAVKDMDDGLAVIGVFLSASSISVADPHYQKLFDVAQHCVVQGNNASLTDGPTLVSLLPASGSYFRYSGSLTTPPCYETVQWTVYQEPVEISLDQLRILQNLNVVGTSSTNSSSASESNHHDADNEDDDDDLSDNYRPTQELNGRIVTGFYDIQLSMTSGAKWHYDGDEGPDTWSSSYEKCQSNQQSPIDFVTDTINASSALNPIQFSSNYSKKIIGSLLNNGHTVMYMLDEELDVEFEDGERTYKAAQLHFHWGSAVVNEEDVKSVGGSEHTVNGMHYPIEMHIVHVNDAEDDKEDNEDHLAVLGVFFQIEDENNPPSETANEALEKLDELFYRVQYEDEDVPDNGPVLMDLLPANKSYYRYQGSLTTPPCSETVFWSVFTHPVIISKERFLAFQSLFKVHRDEVKQGNATESLGRSTATAVPSSALLRDNFRPTQPLNGRTVVIFVEQPTEPEGADVLVIVLCCLGGLCVFCALLVAIVCCKYGKRKDDKRGSYKSGSRNDNPL